MAIVMDKYTATEQAYKNGYAQGKKDALSNGCSMWFITVLEKIEPNEDYIALFGDRRTWGYYQEYETAIRALHENRTDMCEHLYGYAVLEKIEEGICQLCRERKWFKFNRSRQGYFEIEEPECVKCIVNFAIG